MDRSRGQSLLTLTSQQEKGTHRVLFEYLQTSIINILPRLHEIIACIPGATRAIPPTVQDELTVLCEAKVVIAQNPERSEHKDAEVEHPYKVFFQANIPTNNLPASEEPKDTIKFPWSRFVRPTLVVLIGKRILYAPRLSHSTLASLRACSREYIRRHQMTSWRKHRHN